MSEDVNQKENESEIKAFVSQSSKGSDIKKKAAQIKEACSINNMKLTIEKVKSQPYSVLALYAILAVIVIIISMVALKIPVVPVCTIVIIETLLAVCLHNLPIWLHVAVIALEIIFGIIFGRAVLMVLMAALYLAAILSLQFVLKDKK